jgi:hypothetical protein
VLAQTIFLLTLLMSIAGFSSCLEDAIRVYWISSRAIFVIASSVWLLTLSITASIQLFELFIMSYRTSNNCSSASLFPNHPPITRTCGPRTVFDIIHSETLSILTLPFPPQPDKASAHNNPVTPARIDLQTGVPTVTFFVLDIAYFR